MDKAAQKDEAAGGEVDDSHIQRMAEVVGGSVRPIMASTGLLRLQQRLELCAHAEAIGSKFAGWQYGAMVPGGAEVLAWAARLAWDKGWTSIGGDVPNGFPATKTEDAIAAVTEKLPEMAELMLATIQYGVRVFKADGTEVGKIVGGFPQGDPAVPVWFGVVMAKALEDSQAKRAEEVRQTISQEAPGLQQSQQQQHKQGPGHTQQCRQREQQLLRQVQELKQKALHLERLASKVKQDAHSRQAQQQSQQQMQELQRQAQELRQLQQQVTQRQQELSDHQQLLPRQQQSRLGGCDINTCKVE